MIHHTHTHATDSSSSTTAPEIQSYKLSIRTGGGDCRRQLTASFEQFFTSAGLLQEGKFQLNKEYFPLAIENSGVPQPSANDHDL